MENNNTNLHFGRFLLSLLRYASLYKERRKTFNWELIDLDKDPEETTDISSQYPEVIAKVEEIVARERTMSPHERFRFSVLDE